MEIHAGTKNVFTEDPVFFRLIHRHAKSLHRERIFCTDINISVLSAYRISRNNHTLDHLIWITLHNRAVHKGSRVSLVSIAHHIADFFLLSGHLRPLLACREPCSAAAPEAGFGYFIDYFLGSHIKQCFRKRLESACRYILVNGLRIYFSAVFQNNPCLLVQERNIVRMRTDFFLFPVKQTLYRLSLKDGALYDLAAVFRLYMYILIIIRLNSHQGAKFAQALAAGLHHTQVRNIFLHFHLNAVQIFTELLHLIVNFLSSRCHTSGAGADKNTAGIGSKGILNLFLPA